MSSTKIFEQSASIAGLAWGVHQPFRAYLQRISDGRIMARDGAELTESEGAFFPLDNDSTTPNALRFYGSLEFLGHNGMLAVTVQQPWLEHHNGQCRLTIVDPFDPAERMPLVEIEFTDEVIGDTRLTEAGTDLFMGNYTANTLFDPVRMIWEEQDKYS